MVRIGLCLFFIYLLSGCGHSSSKKEVMDTPNSGKIKIGVSHSLKAMIGDEIQAFTAILENRAQVEMMVSSEDSLIQLLQDGQLRMIFIHSALDKEIRTSFFEEHQYDIQSRMAAWDALTFWVHPSFPDSLTFSQLKDVWSGKVKNWKALNPSYPDADITWVTDNTQTKHIQWLNAKFQNNTAPKVYSESTAAGLWTKVKERPGLIAISTLSTWKMSDSSLTKGCKPLAISNSLPGNPCVIPSQKTIYKKLYPFPIGIYSHLVEPHNGLGTGFIAYVCSQPGQIIVQGRGLLPATLKTWIREVEAGTFYDEH